MKPNESHKPQRQQKIAFCGITKSQRTKLFAEIAVVTLLMEISILPATYSSPTTAIAALENSGTVGRIRLKGMDYSFFEGSGGLGSWMLPDGSIEWTTWDPTGVAYFLNFLQASNCTVVRCFMTVQYWLYDTGNYQSHLEYFITQAADRGIYTDLTFWNNNGSGSEPIGVLPWNDAGNNVLNNSADFVNLWGNVSATLKSYPTVMYELWNEPNGNRTDEAVWFNVTQQCINRIRSTGAIQPIVIQWNFGINYDFAYDRAESSMQWVFDYPVTDLLGNLIYSTHIYSRVRATTYCGFYNSITGTIVTDYADINRALAACDVYAVAALHPVFVGEIGDQLLDTTLINGVRAQDIYFNNTLNLLDQNGIGYAGFGAPPWGGVEGENSAYVVGGEANYTLNSAGVILVNHLGGMSYADWLSIQT